MHSVRVNLILEQYGTTVTEPPHYINQSPQRQEKINTLRSWISYTASKVSERGRLHSALTMEGGLSADRQGREPLVIDLFHCTLNLQAI